MIYYHKCFIWGSTFRLILYGDNLFKRKYFMIENENQKRERRHIDDLERLRRFRPIDDTFMRGLFRDNIPLAEFVLRIITGKPDLIITSCETQADMKRVTGARSVCLDAYATDNSGKKYDIEVQRADNGADPHRARYHSSIMDVENLDADQDYLALPDTYVIFITENDFFHQKQPVYFIQNMNITTGQQFNDGAYILYANGEYRGDSDIGKLMHDFNCADADDMHFALLAEKTRYLKENPKGVREMCKVMEDLRIESYSEGLEQGRKEGRVQQARSTALKLSAMGHSVAEISELTGFGAETVKEWLSA